jgi:predicted RNA-binding Zn-ribbon protein involved in translation (DUF1610 family)
MSRRRSSRAQEVKDTSSRATLGGLLDELCVTLGFCLPPDAQEELKSNPPGDVDAFTDAVIRAEGMDPGLIDSALRRQIRELVDSQAGRLLGSTGRTAYACPVCGSEELTAKPYDTWPPPEGLTLTPPYEDLLGRPSYEVCPNCGFEFGNDDNPGGTSSPASFAQYRAEWRADGSQRFSNG